MAGRTDVDWVILTKRVKRMAEALEWILCEAGAYMTITGLLNQHKWPPSNIWLGVTAENQARADERIPILLANWAGPKFVSVEPQLEYIDLTKYLYCEPYAGPMKEPTKGTIGGKPYPTLRYRQGLSWTVVGAESGPSRRSFKVEWAKTIYEQCKNAGIPFFGKQDSDPRPGKPLLIDGREIHEFPESRGAQ